MNEDNELKFSREVLDLLLIANCISDGLMEEKISSLDVIIASLDYPGTILYGFLEDKELLRDINSYSIVSEIVGNAKLYKKVMGREYKEFVKAKKRDIEELILFKKNNTIVLSDKTFFRSFFK